MKIVPLFPRIQTRTVQSNRPAREITASERPQAGIIVNLQPKADQASELNRDEALILLGQTMTLLGQAEEDPSLQDIHGLAKGRAVGLLIQE